MCAMYICTLEHVIFSHQTHALSDCSSALTSQKMYREVLGTYREVLGKYWGTTGKYGGSMGEVWGK